MRTVIAIATLLACSGAWAQIELNEISNDTVADADKVMENFRALESAINSGSGGCSATQQDNSVLIECADGSSGTIAGAGTILVIPPDGTVGETPTSYPSGDIVVVDADGVVLGSGTNVNHLWTIVTDIERDLLLWDQTRSLNNPAGGTDIVPVSSGGVNIHFTGQGCTGLAFVSENSVLKSEIVVNPLGYFFVEDSPNVITNPMLSESMMGATRLNRPPEGYEIQEGQCFDFQAVANYNTVPVTQYTPASEILNARAPLSFIQLP